MSFVEEPIVSQNELGAISYILKHIVRDENQRHDQYIAILNTQNDEKAWAILEKSIYCMNVTYFNYQDWSKFKHQKKNCLPLFQFSK